MNVIYNILENKQHLIDTDSWEITGKRFEDTQLPYFLVEAKKEFDFEHDLVKIKGHHITVPKKPNDKFANNYHYTVELNYREEEIKVHFSFNSNGVRSIRPSISTPSGKKKYSEFDFLESLENSFYDNYRDFISKLFNLKETKVQALQQNLSLNEQKLLDPEDEGYIENLDKVLEIIEKLKEYGVYTSAELWYKNIKAFLKRKDRSGIAKKSEGNDDESKEELSSEQCSAAEECNVKPRTTEKKTAKTQITIRERYRRMPSGKDGINSKISFISELNGAELLRDESVKNIAEIRQNIIKEVREFFENKENITEFINPYINALKQHIIIKCDKNIVLKYILKNNSSTKITEFLSCVNISQFELMELEPEMNYTIMEWAFYYRADSCLEKLINKGFNPTSVSSEHSPLMQLALNPQSIDNLPKFKRKLSNFGPRIMSLIKRFIDPPLYTEFDSYTKAILDLNVIGNNLSAVAQQKGENFIQSARGLFTSEEASKLHNDRDYLAISTILFRLIKIRGQILIRFVKSRHQNISLASDQSGGVESPMQEFKCLEYYPKLRKVVDSMYKASVQILSELQLVKFKTQFDIADLSKKLSEQLSKWIIWEADEVENIKKLTTLSSIEERYQEVLLDDRLCQIQRSFRLDVIKREKEIRVLREKVKAKTEILKSIGAL